MTTPYRFPEETMNTTGAGPDFPGSSGDREKGKFRPSSIARLTQVAVTDDDGNPVARTLEQTMEEILLYQKALLVGLSLLSDSEPFTPADALMVARTRELT